MCSFSCLSIPIIFSFLANSSAALILPSLRFSSKCCGTFLEGISLDTLPSEPMTGSLEGSLDADSSSLWSLSMVMVVLGGTNSSIRSRKGILYAIYSTKPNLEV